MNWLQFIIRGLETLKWRWGDPLKKFAVSLLVLKFITKKKKKTFILFYNIYISYRYRYRTYLLIDIIVGSLTRGAPEVAGLVCLNLADDPIPLTTIKNQFIKTSSEYK